MSWKGKKMKDRFIITGLVEKTLPTGKIQYIYRIQDTLTGRREGEATSTKSKSQALTKAQAKCKALNEGLRGKTLHTINDLLNHYMETYQPAKPSTEALNRHSESVLREIMGKKALDDVTPSFLKSCGIYSNHLSLLRNAYRVAISDKMWNHNPCLGISLPLGATKRDTDAYSIDEIRTIFSHISDLYTTEDRPGHKQKYLFDFIRYGIHVCTGMRSGEVLGMQHGPWMKTGIYKVEHQMVRHKGEVSDTQIIKRIGRGVSLALPKTDSSIREVPIPKALLDLIPHREDGEFIFQSFKNPHLSQRASNEGWSKHVKEAGVRYLHLHNLRRTFATISITDHEENPMVVSSIMGHSSRSVGMTGLYTVIRSVKKVPVVEKMYQELLSDLSPSS